MPLPVKSGISTQSHSSRMWLGIYAEGMWAKVSPPVAENEPTASQQRSLTSPLSEKILTCSFTHTTPPHPDPLRSMAPFCTRAPHSWRRSGSGRGKQGAVYQHCRDTHSCSPPCCAVQRGLFVHRWETWGPRTPADLQAQNSQAHEEHRTSWAPGEQLPRHPLTNRYRWTLLASLPLLCFTLGIGYRHILSKFQLRPR